jgi:hypothetical protein
MKQSMNRQNELQEEQEEQIELSPINSFATELYKSISNLREFSEQNGVYYTLDDDAQQVTSFIGGVVKQLPVGERGDMYAFIDTIAGILDKVKN